MERGWQKIGERTVFFTGQSDELIQFKRFAIAAYSDDFDIAFSAIGLADNNKQYLIDTWELKEKNVKEWIQGLYKNLAPVGLWRNESGAAAAALLRRNGCWTGRILEDVRPVDLKLEIMDIDSTICEGWPKIRESILAQRDIAAIGGAVVVGMRASRKRLGMGL